MDHAPSSLGIAATCQSTLKETSVNAYTNKDPVIGVNCGGRRFNEVESNRPRIQYASSLPPLVSIPLVLAERC